MGFSKIRKKSQKIHMYSDKLSNQFCLKKSHFTSFYWTIFFYQFINKFLDFLISKINVISIFRKVDFFKTFVSSGSIFFIHVSTCTAIAFNISPSPFPFSSFLLVSLSFTFFPPETPPPPSECDRSHSFLMLYRIRTRAQENCGKPVPIQSTI